MVGEPQWSLLNCSCAEKEYKEDKGQVLAPEKILTVRVVKGKAIDIHQVFLHVR